MVPNYRPNWCKCMYIIIIEIGEDLSELWLTEVLRIVQWVGLAETRTCSVDQKRIETCSFYLKRTETCSDRDV